MQWSAEVDAYCERTAAGLGAEPLNALTNLGFLVSAWIAWRCAAEIRGRLLAAALGLVGVASGLFHTLATLWAGAADSAAIGLFALLYIEAAVRDFLGWRRWWRIAGTAASLVFLVATGQLLAAVAPWLGANAGYLAIALLILVWGLALRRVPRLGRGLILAAALLALSIGFRMLDAPLCARLPLGTHWIWHLLNATLLSWLIELRRRHLEAAGAGR